MPSPRVSWRWTPTGRSPARRVAALTRDVTSDGIAGADRVGERDARRRRRRALAPPAASTSAGATGPAYGHPNAVASVTSIAAPSGSPAVIASISASAASGVRPALWRLCASETLTTNCSRSIPAARARCAPRALSTSAHRSTSPRGRRRQLLGVGHRRHAVGSHERGELEVAHAGAARAHRTRPPCRRWRSASRLAGRRASVTSRSMTAVTPGPSRRRRGARRAASQSRPSSSPSTSSVCSTEAGPGVADRARASPVKRGTTPVIGTSQPWVDVTRCTISRARYCGSVSMSGAVKMRPAGTPCSSRQRRASSSHGSVAVHAPIRPSSSAMFVAARRRGWRSARRRRARAGPSPCTGGRTRRRRWRRPRPRRRRASGRRSTAPRPGSTLPVRVRTTPPSS